MLKQADYRVSACLLPLSVYFAGVSAPAHAQEAGPSMQVTWIVLGTIVVMFLFITGFMFYLWRLQKRYFEACREQKMLALLFDYPVGLPSGTIRSVLALLIVTVSLYFLALAMWQGVGGLDTKFPEIMGGLLGTVIGFYFASRGHQGEEDKALRQQVQTMQTRQAESEKEQSREEVDTLLGKISKGIDLVRTVSRVLPADVGQKYIDLADKLAASVKSVEGIVNAGKPEEAVVKASELFKTFKETNPARDVVVNAVASFGTVLSGVMPPIALVTALLAMSVKLGGMAYQKWKARVMHLPFSPAVLPLTLLDANAGFTMLAGSPIFKAAFARQLEENDRPFMKKAAEDFLREASVDKLWEIYHGYFQTLEQFEEGLEQARRMVADEELKASFSLLDNQVKGAVGDYAQLMSEVDKLHTDREALKSLDALMLTAETLHRNNKPVLDILAKVREEEKL
jgi:hypothetical protein